MRTITGKNDSYYGRKGMGAEGNWLIGFKKTEEDMAVSRGEIRGIKRGGLYGLKKKGIYPG